MQPKPLKLLDEGLARIGIGIGPNDAPHNIANTLMQLHRLAIDDMKYDKTPAMS